jgi:uncharacterized protein YdbL (DUF1318 family)
MLLSYRLPREPSTPRITVWRRLKRLGVAQLGDGLVALPADPRTKKQLEWIAEEIGEAGGSSTLWRAQLTTKSQERALIRGIAEARAAEYRTIRDRARVAGSTDAERLRTLRTLRRELRKVRLRDFFPPPERDEARAAVQALTTDANTSTGARA